MRITHFHNVAGVATTLAKYQRKEGHQTSVLVADPHPFGYPGETSYEDFSMLFHGLEHVVLSRVVHYHTGAYIRGQHRWFNRFSKNIDYRLARSVHRKILFHFHGAEIRDENARVISSQFFRERSVVSTPDLLESGPHGSVWLPNPVDSELFFPGHLGNSEKIAVGYYNPISDYVRLYNKPEFIERTLSSMEGRGIVGTPASCLPWMGMPKYFNSIEIWIDKISMSFYGVSACEAAACGVPVITQIGEEERTYVPDCPFVDLSRESLQSAIEYLLDENTRHYIGQKCLHYVTERHEASRIVKSLDQIYESI